MAATAPKPGLLNLFEGFVLTAILQGMPIFAAAALMVRLMGDSANANPTRLMTIATIAYSLLVIWLGSKFPRLRNAYEPLFFDAGLCFSDKIAGWRAKPATSVQLLASVLLLSLLAASAA